MSAIPNKKNQKIVRLQIPVNHIGIVVSVGLAGFVYLMYYVAPA